MNFIVLDLVFQKADSAIHWINHYPADKTMDFVKTYAMDIRLIALSTI